MFCVIKKALMVTLFIQCSKLNRVADMVKKNKVGSDCVVFAEDSESIGLRARSLKLFHDSTTQKIHATGAAGSRQGHGCHLTISEKNERLDEVAAEVGVQE